jgi:hypothetical protein
LAMSPHSVEELGAENPVFGPGVQSAVRAELALMLSAPAFAHSNRRKQFLNHVVSRTLSGHASELKERTIGISVFERANDYDTGGDSIVRVTSNEVRKRIGQFYRESEAEHAIQIELPRGSYVPEFRIRAARRENEGTETSGKHFLPGSGALVAEAGPPSAQFHEHQIGKTAGLSTNQPQGRRKMWSYAAILILVVVTAAVSFSLWRSHSRNEGPQLWNAFENSKVPILICLGAHDIPTASAPSSPERATFSELVLHKETIPVDDATVLTSMASQLGKLGIPFRVAAADQVSLTDFRRQPAILIGAMDNVWTLRLTQDLRYRVEVTRPPNQEPMALIRDSKQPASAPWITDFSVPMSEWKSDYAIVARVDDSITGVPVMIDAGLGNDGSIAASELISSGALMSSLRNEPQCRGKSDFEAVVETSIIDTRPGPPHILRLSCW